MSINATSPTAIAATYNVWAVRRLIIDGDGCVAYGQAPNPGQSEPSPSTVSVTATLVKARVLGSGLWERSPSPADTVTLSIQDVYGYIATNTPQAQAVGAAMNAIVTALEAVGMQEGVL